MISIENILTETIVYVFDVNLRKTDDTIYRVTFKVVGDREVGGIDKAKQKLIEYLEAEGHKKYKYKEWDGIREMPSDSVLISVKMK